MKAVIVCYYADLGRPYEPLIERMTESARAVMPDTRLVILTPTPSSPVVQYFDQVGNIEWPTHTNNLCLERARAISSWAVQCDIPTIFVDPDLEFLSPVEVDGNYDVGLLWRDKPDQPVNTGLIVASGQRMAFWKHYGEIVSNLPKVLHAWFCDQITFSLLTGVCHKTGDGLMVDDARVRLLDMARYCPPSDEVGDLRECNPNIMPWAIHRKGRRKGPGWEDIFGSREEAA